MSVILRFAPSPTGLMHIGNARTAIINWLFARQHNGKFYLRFDDTDTARSRVAFADAIQHDLQWLKWSVDDQFRQSDRLQRYQDIMQHLIDAEYLYPCYETPEELDFKRQRQRAVGKPPIYDRAALKLTPADHQKYKDEDRKPHWRFFLQAEKVVWHDLAHGDITIDTVHTSDPILVRADGSPVYIFSSVVDDIDYGITHILRGNDHITNTAVQLYVWQAIQSVLKLPNRMLPHFAHFPLFTDEAGGKLSKRLGSIGIGDLPWP